APAGPARSARARRVGGGVCAWRGRVVGPGRGAGRAGAAAAGGGAGQEGGGGGGGAGADRGRGGGGGGRPEGRRRQARSRRVLTAVKRRRAPPPDHPRPTSIPRMPAMSATADPYADLHQSYGRCLRDKDFIGRFYEVFLASNPSIPAMFAHTDFSRQRVALRRGITMAIFHAGGSRVVDRGIEEMGAVHARGGRCPVPPALYADWV